MKRINLLLFCLFVSSAVFADGFEPPTWFANWQNSGMNETVTAKKMKANLASEVKNVNNTEAKGNDSQIMKPTDYQILSADISSTTTGYYKIFRIMIADKGGDGLNTMLTKLHFTPAASNTADWSQVIKSVKIQNGISHADITTSSINILTNSIDIVIPNNQLVLPDVSIAPIDLLVELDNTKITDNQVLSFLIDGDDHGFLADPTGTTIASSLDSGDVVSNNFHLLVKSTELRFSQQPTNVAPFKLINPAVEVRAVDAFGNLDLDFNGVNHSVGLTSNGSFDASATSVIDAVNGIATFPNLLFTTEQINVTLTTTAPAHNSYTMATSSTFDILDLCSYDLFISEYTEDGTNDYVEIYNGTNTTVDLSNYSIHFGTVNISLSGQLANGRTYVIAQTSLPVGVSGVVESSLDLSGTLSLQKSGANLDVVTVTSSQTAIRNSNVTAPAATYDVSEWSIGAVNTTGLGTHTVNCPCATPTTHSSNFVFTNNNSTSVDVSWTRGDGTKRIVVCRKATSVDFVPTNNSPYIADNDYLSATEVGSLGHGNKVVYNGSGSSFTLNGLIPGEIYTLKVYEYNCSVGTENYYTGSGELSKTFLAAPADVTGLKTTCTDDNTITINWTNPTTEFDKVFVAIREGTQTPSTPTCEGDGLNAANTNFGSALEYCSNTTNSKYVFNSNGTSVTITGLTAGQVYHIKVFTYRKPHPLTYTTWSPGNEIEVNAVVKDVNNLQKNVRDQGVRLSWNNPASCFDNILVVGKEGSNVNITPSGNTAYTANTVFGNGQDIGSGNYAVMFSQNNFVDISGLDNKKTYYFKVFVKNGSHWSVGNEISINPRSRTLFESGELAIIGFDCDTGSETDIIYLTNTKDIESGTTFGLLNASYEYGAAANTRTNKFYACDAQPKDKRAGKIKFLYGGTSNIAKGSIIAISIPNDATSAITYSINGAPNTTDFSTINRTELNLRNSDKEQLWIYQGNIIDLGTAGNYYSTLDGKIIFGLSKGANWVGFDQGVSATNVSREHPDIECANVVFSANLNVAYYDKANQTLANPNKRALIGSITNEATTWLTPTATSANDIPATTVFQTGFTLNGTSEITGNWFGTVSDDWFACGNWANLVVPTENDNVIIATNPAKISYTTSSAKKFGGVAKCNNLTINANLTIEGSDTLIVYGDLTNNNTLNMNSDPASNNGVIRLYGNWKNNSTFAYGNSTVVFEGGKVNSINSNKATEEFYNLTLNNSNSKGVLMIKHLDIHGTLKQNNNKLNINYKDLTLRGSFISNNSIIQIYRDNSTLSVLGTNKTYDFYFTKAKGLSGGQDSVGIKTIYVNSPGSTVKLHTSMIIHNLTIENGSRVLLCAPHKFRIGKPYALPDYGKLVNNAGPSGLIIGSNASGTAYLLNHSKMSVEATWQKYYRAGKWNFLFPILDAIPSTQLTKTTWNANNPNFYFYDETVEDSWYKYSISNPNGWTNPGGVNLDNSKGYIFYSPEPRVHSMSGGKLKETDQTFTLSYTPHSGTNEYGQSWNNYDGWNLFGNPFACNLNGWDVIESFPTNTWSYKGKYVELGIYYYNPDNGKGKYVYFGNTKYPLLFDQMYDLQITINNDMGFNKENPYKFIPPGSAIFIKAKSAGHGESLIIPENCRRLDNEDNPLSDKNRIKDDSLITDTIKVKFVRLNVQQDDYTDETAVAVFEYATDDRDSDIDGYKMFAFNKTVPQLYSTADDESTSFNVNFVKTFETTKSVKLGVYVGTAGTHYINQTENSLENMHIYLEDKLTNTTKVITTVGSSYEFTSVKGFFTNRFVLHFDMNDAPEQTVELENQSTKKDLPWSYELPANLFSDADAGDTISMTASLSDGSALPEWLSYSNGVFSGTPDTACTYTIRLTCKDKFDATTTADFQLTIYKPLSIDAESSSMLVYPNPSSGLISVSQPDAESTQIRVVSAKGELVHAETTDQAVTNIDLSSLAKGVYFVEIRNSKFYKKEKVILK